MPTPLPMTGVSLEVPARPDFMHVLRSVVAGVAARLDFGYEDIEDLRLAVDEACAYLLDVGADGSSLRLEILPDPAAIRVVASIDSDGSKEVGEPRRSLFWHILGTLTTDARFEHTDRGPSIAFSKQRSDR